MVKGAKEAKVTNADKKSKEKKAEVVEVVEEIETVAPKSRRTQKIENAIEGLGLNTGVLYVSHLPWGINEDGLRKYFQQFGKIERYILPRSKDSGRIKGYAFIEYENLEIAQIAAKTMNNYILFDKILKCSVITDRSRYNTIFKRWKRQFKFFNKYKAFVEKRNKIKTPEEIKERMRDYLEKEEGKRLKLKELGLNYEFPGFKALIK